MMRVQGRSILRESKAKKFYARPINRSLRRAAAIDRQKKAVERLRLRKLGMIR